MTLPNHLKLIIRVLETLQDECGCTPKSIAAELKIPQWRVYTIFNHLRTMGFKIDKHDGLYWLNTNELPQFVWWIYYAITA
jgi:DNA-binding IclR family transcriptional regulator